MKIFTDHKARVAPIFHLLVLVSIIFKLQICVAAQTEPASAKAKLATVASPVKESTLNTVVLAEEAEKRLGVSTSKVVSKAIARARIYSGEILVPADRALTTQAPFTGTVAMSGKLPRPGDRVRKGQTILELLPMLAPEAKTNLEVNLTDMQGQLSNAETQQHIAEIALQRAQQLFEDKAGSKRSVQEAQASYDQANDSLKALRQRQQLVTRALGNHGAGKTVLTAPGDGVLTVLNVQSGQVVPGGTVLFTVANQSTVWVRTAIPVGDLGQILGHDNATIQNFSRQAAPRFIAHSIIAPPSAVVNTMTVDVYHELNNQTAGFVPGQRVSVELQQRGQGSFDTIPWSAVIFDIHGNTWVYEKTSAHTYSRMRVLIDHVSGAIAAIQHGPALGKDIVDNGAQELFALETGFTK